MWKERKALILPHNALFPLSLLLPATRMHQAAGGGPRWRSLKISLALPICPSLSLSLFLTFSCSLSLFLTFSRSLFLTFSLSPSFILSLVLSLFLTFSLSYFLSFSLSLPLSHRMKRWRIRNAAHQTLFPSLTLGKRYSLGKRDGSLFFSPPRPLEFGNQTLWRGGHWRRAGNLICGVCVGGGGVWFAGVHTLK